MREDLRRTIASSAQRLGISPIDLATVISYETAGTFDPRKKGPTTQWGQHEGLIQWGKPQAQKYLGGDFSIPKQGEGIVAYMQDAGVKPGMGLLDVYSAVNAGRVGRYNASDANNGGAPGTVADKVNGQMAGHRRKAEELFAGFAPEAPDGPKGQEAYARDWGDRPDGAKGQEAYPFSQASPFSPPSQSPNGIPADVANYLTSPDPKPLGERLGGFFQALAQTPNAPAPRRGLLGGDARQSGEGLSKILQDPSIAGLLMGRRLGA